MYEISSFQPLCTNYLEVQCMQILMYAAMYAEGVRLVNTIVEIPV